MATLSLNQLPPAGKVAVGALMCGLLAIAYYALFHTDLTSSIEREQRQTTELTGELARQRQAQASYLADRDELALRQQKEHELNKILPMDTQAATFLSALQSVSNTSGIDLKAWTPMDEVPQTFYAKVPMRLQLTGRFHQIAKFIYDAGKQERIINMENVELLDPKLDGDDVVLKANCLATTFHLLKKAPAVAATPATPAAPATAAVPAALAPPAGARPGGH